MDELRLQVYFEDPFWVGLFERYSRAGMQACRVVFGAEPKDVEVYAFICAHLNQLKFSPAVSHVAKPVATNPKRRLREARRALAQSGPGTKAQQALQAQREQNKVKRRTTTREQREAEAKRRFALKQQKRKEKHRGH